jgi:phage-related holin
MKQINDTAPVFYVFGTWFMTMLEASGIDVAILIVLGGAFATDYVMGLLASFKTKEFKSRIGLIGFLSKLFGIVIIILISMLLNMLGIPNKISLTGMFTLFAINDILSALRHWYTIKTGEKLTEYDAITTFIRSMHEYLKGIASKFMPIKDPTK